jgi:hypothetical protein
MGITDVKLKDFYQNNKELINNGSIGTGVGLISPMVLGGYIAHKTNAPKRVGLGIGFAASVALTMVSFGLKTIEKNILNTPKVSMNHSIFEVKTKSEENDSALLYFLGFFPVCGGSNYCVLDTIRTPTDMISTEVEVKGNHQKDSFKCSYKLEGTLRLEDINLEKESLKEIKINGTTINSDFVGEKFGLLCAQIFNEEKFFKKY